MEGVGVVAHILWVVEEYSERLRELEKSFVEALEMKEAVAVIKDGDEEVLERTKGQKVVGKMGKVNGGLWAEPVPASILVGCSAG